jgi:transcriptional regulator with XRE-family HTH domain
MDTLKPLIRAAGETQRTIAIQLNVSEPSMSRWVTREASIPLEYVTQLAEILGTDVGTIVRLGRALPKERESAA